MIKYLRFLGRLNFKTIYFNFKYLPFAKAIKFPVLISRKVYLRVMSGRLIFDCPMRPGLVKIGYGSVGIFDNKRSRSIWQVYGTVVFKGKCDIGHGSKISVGNNGKLTLGENFIISAESSIVAASEIQFGNDCILSWDILVMDNDFHKIKDEHGNILNPPMPIRIGNKVWMGCRTLILKGAVIPDNCVIGAETVVSKVLEKGNSVYLGNPVKKIKENITWVS